MFLQVDDLDNCYCSYIFCETLHGLVCRTVDDEATSPTAGATSPTAGATSPTAGVTSPTAGVTSPTTGAYSRTLQASLPKAAMIVVDVIHIDVIVCSKPDYCIVLNTVLTKRLNVLEFKTHSSSSSSSGLYMMRITWVFACHLCSHDDMPQSTSS